MTIAANILAALANSQASLSASQTLLTEAFTLTFGKSTPAVPAKPSAPAKTETKAKATPKASTRKPKADTPKPSNKAAKAEAKAAKREEMRRLYGADWHKTYTLHPVTLEPRLRSAAVDGAQPSAPAESTPTELSAEEQAHLEAELAAQPETATTDEQGSLPLETKSSRKKGKPSETKTNTRLAKRLAKKMADKRSEATT